MKTNLLFRFVTAMVVASARFAGGSASDGPIDYASVQPVVIIEHLARLTGSSFEYRVTKKLPYVSLQLAEHTNPDFFETAVIDLLALQGVELVRDGSVLRVSDTSDLSVELVAANRDLALERRVSSLLLSISGESDDTGFSLEASEMDLGSVMRMLQLITGRPVICDGVLPRHAFSQKPALTRRVDAVAAIDRFLSAHSMVLVERASGLLVVAYDHDRHPDMSPDSDLPTTDDAIRARMEAIAERIRKERAAKREAAGQQK